MLRYSGACVVQSMDCELQPISEAGRAFVALRERRNKRWE
jgi:hypothetical protein